ncbi:AAA family ATPase [Roseovarius nanhaiticus]|uniref:AAA family ATPase n=1 Tax=Roseovarius nanhaiticus TaxID=573024 RepID=UPI0024922484|nr:AAA family ATPase [Roseovarius nanhaiticus]
MDILQIRGENIASLARPFDISLDAPPLDGAGLFAITGQTGSGKSSLLDAMCLALYGECPRLSSAGVSDTVPDISGEALASSDPRTLLRRGAASGYAIVRFRARSGEDYEASWSVRRAYGKASARLQAVERSVTRLSDGTVLENQKTAVNDRIVTLTGLTYDEFRRSVLLAQGDFDSFLSARTSERAAILEKVTGTQLYRDISKRVFAAHGEAERAVEDLEMKLGEHSVLTEEERADIEAELTALDTARREAAEVLKATIRDIDRHEALIAARTRSIEAAETEARARANWEARKDDTAELARLRRAARIRAEEAERRAAAEAKDLAETAIDEAARAVDAARAVKDTAEADWTKASAAQQQSEARFAELGPIWTRATTLDAEVKRAAEEEATAARAAEEAGAEATATEDALKRGEADLTQRAARITDLQAACDADPEGHALVAGWPILSDRLERRIAASHASAKALEEVQRLKAGLAGAAERSAQITEAAFEARAESARIEEGRTARAPRRDALRKAAPSERLTRLARSRDNLRTLADLARQHDEAARDAATGKRDEATAAETIHSSEAAITAAEQAQGRAATQIEALEAPAGLAEAALSSEAARLRLHLVDGQPCPVCHAVDHPVHEDDAARQLADDLRSRLATARATAHEAAQGIAAATARIGAAQSLAQTSAERRVDAEARQARLAAEFAEARRAEAEGPLGDTLPDTPQGAGPALALLAQRLDDWQKSLEADLAELEDLDRRAQEDEARIAALAASMRALQDDQAGLDAQNKSAERALGTAQSAAAAHAETVTELDRMLERDFAGLRLDWVQFGVDGADALDGVRTRKEAHSKARAALEAALAERDEAKRRQEALEVRCSAAQTAWEKARAAHDVRADKTKALRAERAPLLGGEDTSAHRTAFNTRRKALQEQEKTANGARSAAVSKLSSAEASLKAAQDTRDRAIARRAAAEAAWQGALAQAGLDAETAQALLGWSDADIAALETAIDTARTAHLRAAEARDQRASDLAKLEAEGVPETPLPDLQERRTAREAAQTQHIEDEASLRGRLKSDRDTRAKMAALVAQIAKAKARLDTLAAINAAIGSASGDRFSTIAQEVTLAILVEQANHHLADIKPRYRLARGQGKLSLHVVDDDMAGEIRSTRSLSGGERFLVSLALALALGAVGGTGTISNTLFIDEGFGTLDAGSLDMAIDALEALQAQGRTIGVISHVQAMQDRIPVQIRIKSRGAGASEVVLDAG